MSETCAAALLLVGETVKAAKAAIACSCDAMPCSLACMP